MMKNLLCLWRPMTQDLMMNSNKKIKAKRRKVNEKALIIAIQSLMKMTSMQSWTILNSQ